MGITFNEIGDDCSICPFRSKGCTGIANNGNGPVYPPCSELDPDMDLDIYMQKMEERAQRHRVFLKEQAARRIEEEKQKEHRKRRRQYSDSQCSSEMKTVASLKKLKSSLERAISSGEMDLNFMDVMERAGIRVGEAEKARCKLADAKKLLEKTTAALEAAKQQLSEKRTAVMKSEAYKSIK